MYRERDITYDTYIIYNYTYICTHTLRKCCNILPAFYTGSPQAHLQKTMSARSGPRCKTCTRLAAKLAAPHGSAKKKETSPDTPLSAIHWLGVMPCLVSKNLSSRATHHRASERATRSRHRRGPIRDSGRPNGRVHGCGVLAVNLLFFHEQRINVGLHSKHRTLSQAQPIRPKHLGCHHLNSCTYVENVNFICLTILINVSSNKQY